MSQPFTVGHRHALFAIAGSVIALAVVVSTAPRLRAQRPAPHVRVIPEGLQPIVDRLLPDDEVVVISRGEEDVLLPDHDLTVPELIQEAVGMSDLIATVDVQEVTGFLADDGMWINTRVVGTVRQVLSSTKMPTQVGQRIEIEWFGGELRIGKVLVRAGYTIQPRRRYLWFLEAEPTRKTLSTTRMPFVIQNGTLVRPWSLQPTETRDLLEGVKLAEFTKQIRRFSK
jgi:hypothetical protein